MFPAKERQFKTVLLAVESQATCEIAGQSRQKPAATAERKKLMLHKKRTESISYYMYAKRDARWSAF
jgi:hypothetical protein